MAGPRHAIYRFTQDARSSAWLAEGLKKAKVICLDIPDDYEFMDPVLVRLLEAKVPPYLG